MITADHFFALTQPYREEFWRGMLPDDRIAFMDSVSPAQWRAHSLGNPGFTPAEHAAWLRVIERGRAVERKQTAWRAANRATIERALDEHPFDRGEASRLLSVLEPGFQPATTKFLIV